MDLDIVYYYLCYFATERLRANTYILGDALLQYRAGYAEPLSERYDVTW